MILIDNTKSRLEKKIREFSTGLSASCWMGVCIGYGPGSLDDVIVKIQVAIGWFTGFSALVAVILLVYAGYNFILAGGDPDKITKATNIITNTVIGLVIVFISRMILLYIIDTVLI
ncbi:hypothetical protein H6763_03100 [Candidatus Nomurabacteria bacterium]|uniref:Uncharacterized protein n=1 Tax=Candidatus Dojkabacteria bacterium TaxID=2099670 RepID=A0A955KXF1_9BACT|nr:hypothetical protein [Candidatus Dojkabacteria bacterium]MCB9789472.1 hypothetical protein [Candidatus Nomurabacteria bacterium]MCB9803794.1 hypothetical protein [Candidatus Nomurabacteria bacterium]